MGTVSVSIPDDLKIRMTDITDVNWSAVARKAFEDKIREAEFLKKIAKKSQLTEKDADDIARRINKAVIANLFNFKTLI